MGDDDKATVERLAMEAAFKERLKAAIATSPLSKGELARAVGVDPARVSDWLRAPGEKGATMPSAENLWGLTKALGVSGHWLLTGEGDQVVPPGDDARVLEEIRALVSPRPEGAVRAARAAGGTRDRQTKQGDG